MIYTLITPVSLLVVIRNQSQGLTAGNSSPFEETFGAVNVLCRPTVATNMQGTLMIDIADTLMAGSVLQEIGTEFVLLYTKAHSKITQFVAVVPTESLSAPS
ncbi:hypothetical protein BDZ94DRAFT_785568 [Collybia nuda]|uniref:Uncharacterized protein n=1 Tax=Collybia nuda TaxID=64659 RepID=A0A9P6CNM3_9AGAR|nr:hypothetical protein BDZ94DRAFT_785568 [Collybia nuda]